MEQLPFDYPFAHAILSHIPLQIDLVYSKTTRIITLFTGESHD
jgi:hypothetical protein